MTNSSVLLLALMSSVTYGIWATLAQVASRRLSPELTVVISCSFAAITIASYTFYSGDQTSLSSRGLIFALLTGLTLSVGMLSFYRGVEIGSTAIVSPVVGLHFVVSAVLAVLFLDATLQLDDLLGIGFAMLSIVLIAR